MTSMWMLENEDGAFMVLDEDSSPVFDASYQSFASADKELIETYRREEGGHLVEMVPAKPKVPVSQEEAKLIDDAVDSPGAGLASVIADYVDTHFSYISGDDCMDEEFRLMEAAIDGYSVVEPTEYNVKVPHATDSYYAKHSATGKLNTWDKYDDAQMRNSSVLFTMYEIKRYGLEDCERVEINTEDSDDD